jgi:hypothetical protein
VRAGPIPRPLAILYMQYSLRALPKIFDIFYLYLK